VILQVYGKTSCQDEIMDDSGQISCKISKVHAR